MLQVEEATPAGEVEPPSRTWELGTPPVGEEDGDAAGQDAEGGSREAAVAEAVAPADAARGARTEETVEEAAGDATEEFVAAEEKTVALPGGGKWQVTCDEDACEVRGTNPRDQ
jgi:hypothetical protein